MRSPLHAVVTTVTRPDAADERVAEAEAARLGLELVPRRNAGLARLLASAQAVLVVGVHERALYTEGCEEPLRSVGALGIPRARNLARGGRDALVEAGLLAPGDRFVDATAGRCGDAWVAEAAVGPEGEVVALEASPLVHAVMCFGLEKSGSRVRLLRADHASWLRDQPSKSVDVVYFDPMFRTPLRSRPDFDTLRQVAEPGALSREVLAEAVRVARRRVLLLDSPDGAEILRLGMEPVPAGRWASRRFGMLDATRPPNRAASPA